MGNEDQGWVAHFLISALEDRAITIYGDGMQVRDVLYVEDLVRAFLLARSHTGALCGRAFNIGGGPANTLSLLELIRIIGKLHGPARRFEWSDWRAGDQRYYVSDTRKFQAATGWRPKVGPDEGVAKLYQWLRDTRGHEQQRTTHVGPELRRLGSRSGSAGARLTSRADTEAP